MINVRIKEAAFGARGPVYETALEDGTKLGRTIQPLYHCARALLRLGYSGDEELVIRRHDREQIDMRGHVGRCAELTVY